MIEKLEPLQGLDHSWLNKINELVDVANALIKENNIHEKQIDELQMKVEPAENTTISKMENVAENGKCAKNAQDGTPRCPFCQQEIKIAGEHTTIMSCFNGDCKGSGLYGEKAFWQELIRTRKALDVAVGKLKGIKAYYDDSYADPHFVNWHIVAQRLANDADDTIKSITALEQKD